MHSGDMTTPILMLLLFGWMYTEFRHKSDFAIARFLPIVFAIGFMFDALIEGAYWAIFPPANHYPVDDWRLLGLTRNKWAAIGIGIAVFFLPELFWQLRGWLAPSANLRAQHALPECILRIWPQSATAEISVRNLAKGPITITRIEAVNYRNERLKLETDHSLLGAAVSHLETARADYRASSWYPDVSLWVHGEHVNGLQWSLKAKQQLCGPDAPSGLFRRHGQRIALAAVIAVLFVAGVAFTSGNDYQDTEYLEAPAEEATAEAPADAGSAGSPFDVFEPYAPAQPRPSAQGPGNALDPYEVYGDEIAAEPKKISPGPGR